MERWYHTHSNKFNRYIELKVRTTYPGFKYAICVNGVVKQRVMLIECIMTMLQTLIIHLNKQRNNSRHIYNIYTIMCQTEVST